MILPFLKKSFERGEESQAANSMLDILSRLVQEQPTAMALIRQVCTYGILAFSYISLHHELCCSPGEWNL